MTPRPTLAEVRSMPPWLLYTLLLVCWIPIALAAWWIAGGWRHGVAGPGVLGVIDRTILLIGWCRIIDILASRTANAALRCYARRLVRKLRLIRDARRHDPAADEALTKAINDINTAFKPH